MPSRGSEARKRVAWSGTATGLQAEESEGDPMLVKIRPRRERGRGEAGRKSGVRHLEGRADLTAGCREGVEQQKRWPQVIA